jgi:hypothetical protein
MVGPEVGKFSGGLANRGDEECPNELTRQWKYADVSGWRADPGLTIKCTDVKPGKESFTRFCDFARCFLNLQAIILST